MYLCRDSSGKIKGLAKPKNNGIEFYPLPFGETQFFGFKKLTNGFFMLENISREIGDAVMNLRDGTFDVPVVALKKRIAKIELILGIGSLKCVEILK